MSLEIEHAMLDHARQADDLFDSLHRQPAAVAVVAGERESARPRINAMPATDHVLAARRILPVPRLMRASTEGMRSLSAAHMPRESARSDKDQAFD